MSIDGGDVILCTYLSVCFNPVPKYYHHYGIINNIDVYFEYQKKKYSVFVVQQTKRNFMEVCGILRCV